MAPMGSSAERWDRESRMRVTQVEISRLDAARLIAEIRKSLVRDVPGFSRIFPIWPPQAGQPALLHKFGTAMYKEAQRLENIELEEIRLIIDNNKPNANFWHVDQRDIGLLNLGPHPTEVLHTNWMHNEEIEAVAADTLKEGGEPFVAPKNKMIWVTPSDIHRAPTVDLNGQIRVVVGFIPKS